MEGFAWINVESSITDTVAYKAETNQFRIIFKNKSEYEYDNVSQEEFNGIETAESQGKYIQQIIKGKTFRRVMKNAQEITDELPEQKDFKRKSY